MDFSDLHGLTSVRCNLYGYLWFLKIQTYNHSTLYIRTVVSLQWHQLCFVNTKVNDLWHNKLCFVCLLYMGVLQRDPIPKLCFAMVLTICKDFFAHCKDFLSWSYRYELSQVDTCALSRESWQYILYWILYCFENNHFKNVIGTSKYNLFHTWFHSLNLLRSLFVQDLIFLYIINV